MAKLDDDVTTFRVAMLTEDLSDDEQKAMRKTAERLEREWNSLTHVDKRVRLRGPLSLFAEWLEVNPQRTEPSKVARQSSVIDQLRELGIPEGRTATTCDR